VLAIKNKEELFESIVDPVFNSLLNMIRSDNEKHCDIHQFIEESGLEIANLINKKRKEILIILDGSKGTKYEDAKKRYLDMMTTHIEGHIVEKIKITNKSINLFLARLFATSFIEGYIEIIRNFGDTARIKEIIFDFMKFTFNGWNSLFE